MPTSNIYIYIIIIYYSILDYANNNNVIKHVLLKLHWHSRCETNVKDIQLCIHAAAERKSNTNVSTLKVSSNEHFIRTTSKLRYFVRESWSPIYEKKQTDSTFVQNRAVLVYMLFISLLHIIH